MSDRAATESALQLLEERIARLEKLMVIMAEKFGTAIQKIANATSLCMALSETARSTHLEAAEKATIENALAATAGNKTRAAKLLGCTVKTLYNKMARYGIGQDGGGA